MRMLRILRDLGSEGRSIELDKDDHLRKSCAAKKKEIRYNHSTVKKQSIMYFFLLAVNSALKRPRLFLSQGLLCSRRSKVEHRVG